MRISLLLQREPFEKILKETLESFWSFHYNKPFEIRWLSSDVQITKTARNSQSWHVNAYLNAIFAQNVNRCSFIPLRMEFNRSRSCWRRPFQRAYVEAATTQPLAGKLAQSHFLVIPAIENSASLMVVPGNHKIRILDWNNQCCWATAKAGFSMKPINQEISARQTAEKFGLQVPKLLEVDHELGIFCEEFITGTPLNRLARKSTMDDAYRQAAQSLSSFAAATLASCSLREYVARLRDQITFHLNSIQVLNPSQKGIIHHLIDQVCDYLEPIEVSQIYLCQAHGDFQPANLLLDERKVWIIDWEYARQCQAGYDGLVYQLESRFPRGLSTRLKAFIYSNDTTPKWPGADWSSPQLRQRAICLFCMEELALHLEENDNPLFFRCGDGLRVLVEEMRIWLEALN